MPQILSQRRSGATKYYHADALGSTRLLTDASQVVSDSNVYEAFGKIVASSGSTTNPLKFVGMENYYDDGASGLLLLGVRFYDPKTGRFVSVDPAKEGENWYAYVWNNPIGVTDPLGEWGIIVVTFIIAGVVIYCAIRCGSPRPRPAPTPTPPPAPTPIRAWKALMEGLGGG